jgi:hypothetical protein
VIWADAGLRLTQLATTAKIWRGGETNPYLRILPENRRLFQRYERSAERDLRRARPRLFRALEQFANIRSDKEGWAHFRKLWPDFFPSDEYEKAVQGLKTTERLRNRGSWDFPLYHLNLMLIGMKAFLPTKAPAIFKEHCTFSLGKAGEGESARNAGRTSLHDARPRSIVRPIAAKVCSVN